MTVPEILKALEPYTGKFPREAMEEAVAQREAITPELLRVLEAVAENPTEYAGRKDFQLPLFSVFLLAQFREKRAYPAIVKMMSAPGEIPFDLLGDTVTEVLCNILASVYDGNPEPLQGLVENPQVNEYVRYSAIETFLVLENTGQMPRDEVAQYLRTLLQGRLERTESSAWNGVARAVAELPAPELLEDVRKAFEEGLVDPDWASLENIEKDIVAPKPWWREVRVLITDAIEELEWWACFDEDETHYSDDDVSFEDEELEEEDYEDFDLPPPLEPLGAYGPPPGAYEPAQPYVRGEPKIGRNDPCPCGSGLKYKKCCGK